MNISSSIHTKQHFNHKLSFQYINQLLHNNNFVYDCIYHFIIHTIYLIHIIYYYNIKNHLQQINLQLQLT